MSKTRNIILFETESMHLNLLPLAYTRPVADCRVGIMTLREKWERRLPGVYSYLTVKSLREIFCPADYDGEGLYIASNVLPSDALVKQLNTLPVGTRLVDADGVVACHGKRDLLDHIDAADIEVSVTRIKYVFDIFLNNGAEIVSDYRLIVGDRKSRRPDSSVNVIGDMMTPDGCPTLFIEEGAEVIGCTINLTAGPVYIGRNAQVMEGACLRGPIAICDQAKVRMGAKIYSATTLGPCCKAGGEIDNAVMFGYSNKAHDGYLGNAVIGEWCNIGAGVNASNLKNDYSKIRIWNYEQRRFMRTQLQFCGLIMGDHSKAGINCMFNTATVVGVGVNVHGCGFPRVFIPSFSEGSPESGFSDVTLSKFFDIAERVMSRRGLSLTERDHRLYENIYKFSSELK